MNRLTSHIISLLRIYDTVTVPGLGSFTIKNVPARWDHESLTVYPPSLSIGFSGSYESEGALLLQSYINNEGLRPEAAEYELNSDISYLKNQLELLGSAQIEGIGTLTREDDRISFRPAFSLQLPLPEVSIPRIEAEVLASEPEDAPVPKSVAVEDSFKDRSHYHYHNPNYYYLPIHKKFANIAACLLLVVIVGLVTYFPLQSPNNPHATASMLPISVTPPDTPVKMDNDTPIAADTVSAQQDTVAAATVETVEENPVATVTYPEERPAEKKYYAVVAALKTQKEVDRFMADHNNSKAKFNVIQNSRFNLITVAESDDKAELQANMPLVRAEYPDAWIYSRK